MKNYWTGLEVPRPKNPGKTIDFYRVCETKGIEQVPQGDGINYSYNISRRISPEKPWVFYKSAYKLERALEIYDNI
jgi:hypothetical protein